MFKQLPRLISVIKKEKKVVAEIVRKEQISGIVSDNRFGVRNENVPSVYLTHQINVFSGNTTWLTSKIHQNIIKRFDECWIPDINDSNNFSGLLSDTSSLKIPFKFLGIQSRLKKIELEKIVDLLILLSGPEPQRSLLENKLLAGLKNRKEKVLFVRGVFNCKDIEDTENITFKNHLLSSGLEQAINQSKLIVARSGYSTILDLAKTGSKAYFIPTPGQFEQEHLAQRLKRLKIAPFNSQDKFKIDDLIEVDNYLGFKNKTSDFDLGLFQFFKRKCKL